MTFTELSPKRMQIVGFLRGLKSNSTYRLSLHSKKTTSSVVNEAFFGFECQNFGEPVQNLTFKDLAAKKENSFETGSVGEARIIQIMEVDDLDKVRSPVSNVAGKNVIVAEQPTSGDVQKIKVACASIHPI